jgi:hypothetical protein
MQICSNKQIIRRRKKQKWEEIQCKIIPNDNNSNDKIEMISLSENIQRINMKTSEKIRAFKKLYDKLKTTKIKELNDELNTNLKKSDDELKKISKEIKELNSDKLNKDLLIDIKKNKYMYKYNCGIY